MHLAQNSGPPKTQVFIETQGIFRKTQGQISKKLGFRKNRRCSFLLTDVKPPFGIFVSSIIQLYCETQINWTKTQVKLTKTQVEFTKTQIKIFRKLRFLEILYMCRTLRSVLCCILYNTWFIV